MQDANLDVNLIIQVFQEKVNQLTTENIIKDATIRQLAAQMEELTKKFNDGFEQPETKKGK